MRIVYYKTDNYAFYKLEKDDDNPETLEMIPRTPEMKKYEEGFTSGLKTLANRLSIKVEEIENPEPSKVNELATTEA